MNDLPKQPQPSQSSVASGVSKEVEQAGWGSSEFPLTDRGIQERELPKEVAQAGVTVQPTTVAIPPPVAQMGVQSVGQNASLGTGATIVLPLTDDQIEIGLHQNVMSSFRWLAEWCVRRLKQFHVKVREVHGRLVRGS